MANVEINDIAAKATPVSTDELEIQATGGGTSNKATLLNAEKGMIETGAGAPSSTPNHVGQRYVDTTNDNVYIATDTASSADWEQATLGGATINSLPSATIAGTEELLLDTDEKASIDEVHAYMKGAETGTLLLNLGGAIADPTNPPAFNTQSGTNRPYWAFDGTATIESVVWVFRMPADYSSGLTAKIQWSGSASTTVTHTVQWTVYIMALTPDVDGAADSDSYDTENVVSDDILGTTAKRIQEASVALSNADSVAAGDYVAVRLLRDYSDAADDLAEDAWLWGFSLEYTRKVA